ncbi:hypothetical protein [Yoonia sp.]|uniref:hypothetical protein n=1 Tax=Yoonia sp. TaxID=2212373 RepID=UPI003F6DA16F
MKRILVPVSPADLIDRLTRLHLKAQQTRLPAARAEVLEQIVPLQQIADNLLPALDDLDRLWGDLADANADLFALRADLRRCDEAADFGPGFVALSRAYIVAQDSRERIREQIDLLLNKTAQHRAGRMH